MNLCHPRRADRNTPGDHVPASYSPRLANSLHKPVPCHIHDDPSRLLPKALGPRSAGIAAPPHSWSLGLAKGQTKKKKKGNKSKQKNSPDPPINTHTHTKEQACGRGSSHQHLPRGGAGGPLIVLPPQACDDNPSPGQVAAPLPCSQQPSSFPTSGPLRKTPRSRCHRPRSGSHRRRK